MQYTYTTYIPGIILPSRGLYNPCHLLLGHHVLGCPGQDVRINGDRINGLGYNLLIYGIYWGEITHLLTIDANFQRDIQVSAFFDIYLWPESGKLGGGVKYVTSTWGNDPKSDRSGLMCQTLKYP